MLQIAIDWASGSSIEAQKLIKERNDTDSTSKRHKTQNFKETQNTSKRYPGREKKGKRKGKHA